MSIKKIMFLGAAAFQMPPIIYAKEKGYQIITCDNRPENPGHRLADKYYNISTLDRVHLLKAAEKERIDGVLTFASDISAPAAAFISQELKIPGNSIETIESLVNKGRFRRLLNDLNPQNSRYSVFELKKKEVAIEYFYSRPLPAVVKPVDSSGSKGVSIIEDPAEIRKSVDIAFNESVSKTIIIEDFIAKEGFQVCGDGFMENGKLGFIFYGNGHFYEEPGYNAPWGETFPSEHDKDDLKALTRKIEEILLRIGYKSGPFNLDVFLMKNGRFFINEIGPRGGGNFIPEAIRLKTGFDMIAGAVESSIDQGYKLRQIHEENPDFFSCYMVHSKSIAGILKRVEFSERIKSHILVYYPYLNAGSKVYPFIKGNLAIGSAVLKFKSVGEMMSLYSGSIHSHFNAVVDE